MVASVASVKSVAWIWMKSVAWMKGRRVRVLDGCWMDAGYRMRTGTAIDRLSLALLFDVRFTNGVSRFPTTTICRVLGPLAGLLRTHKGAQQPR